jgi:hypothetical protein
MALHYEEHLMSWEGTVYARPELSIRIADGRHRFVTHILLPVGLASDAQEAWRQERREQAFGRFRCLAL